MDIIFRDKEQWFGDDCLGLTGKLRKALVHHEGYFYLVSENTLVKETLIFLSSPTGEVKSWNEVGGGKGVTLEEVLDDFEKELFADFRESDKK